MIFNDVNFIKKSKVFLVFSIFSILLIISYIFIEETFYGDKTKKVALKNAIEQTLERQDVLNSFLDNSKSQLNSIRNSISFKGHIKFGNYIYELEQTMYSFSLANKDFMQLRYINKNGDEIIRIDREFIGAHPYFVEQNKLQNKSQRYYFRESKNKDLDKVWFSSIDLNIENKEIQLPHNPTLRAILPIQTDDKFNGILIINYFMNEFLDKFVNLPLYDVLLFDNYGYTIVDKINNKSWGNSLEHKHNIKSVHNKYYIDMLSNNLFENSECVSRKLDVPIHGGLNILLKLKSSYLKNENKRTTNQYIVIGTLTLILSMFLTSLFYKLYSNELLNIEKLEELNRNLKILYNHFRKFINIQDNIIILTNGRKLEYVNNKFKKYFNYKSINKFLKEHQCISEFFLDTSDEFFHLGKIDIKEEWINEIKKLPIINRNVALMNSKGEVHYFKVDLTRFDKDLYVVSFTDITSNILEKFSFERKINHDKLTGSLTREFFYNNHDKIYTSYNLTRHQLGIAFLDIDNFKSVNDTYGHEHGDVVLRNLAKLLNEHTRDNDYVFRWGGEEFLIILRINDSEQLKQILEKIRHTIESTEISDKRNITCSIGGAIYETKNNIDLTIKKADENMYLAKQMGKNKVVVN